MTVRMLTPAVLVFCLLTACEPRNEPQETQLPHVAVSHSVPDAPASDDVFELPSFRDMLSHVREHEGRLPDSYKSAFFPDWACASFSVEGILKENLHYALLLTQEDCVGHHEEKLFTFDPQGKRIDSVSIHRGVKRNAWPLGKNYLLQNHDQDGEEVKYLLEIGDLGQFLPDFSVPDNILGCIHKLPPEHPRLDTNQFPEAKGRFAQLWASSTLDIRNGYLAYQFPGESEPMYSLDFLRNPTGEDLLLSLYRECKNGSCQYELEAWKWNGEKLRPFDQSPLPEVSWADFVADQALAQTLTAANLPLNLAMELPWHGNQLKVRPQISDPALAELNLKREDLGLRDLSLRYSHAKSRFLK